MKICEYCGSECKDEERVCSACGGNSFKKKCPDCGTLFTEGDFCPACGVKFGAEGHVCPRCGTKFYKTLCPGCGYILGERYESDQPRYNPRRKTALWVLGWIFCFPVPLTILIVRSKSLPKWAKIVLIAALWIGLWALGKADGSSTPAA